MDGVNITLILKHSHNYKRLSKTPSQTSEKAQNLPLKFSFGSTFSGRILSIEFLREQVIVFTRLSFYGKLINDVSIEQWLPSLGRLVVGVETFLFVPFLFF